LGTTCRARRFDVGTLSGRSARSLRSRDDGPRLAPLVATADILRSVAAATATPSQRPLSQAASQGDAAGLACPRSTASQNGRRGRPDTPETRPAPLRSHPATDSTVRFGRPRSDLPRRELRAVSDARAVPCGRVSGVARSIRRGGRGSGKSPGRRPSPLGACSRRRNPRRRFSAARGGRKAGPTQALATRACRQPAVPGGRP
jgi:hypothetical protein